MGIKHAAEPGNKQQEDTRRQDTNKQATKSFKNYCRSSEPPKES